MARPLRVLLVEDSPADAELLVRELRRAGFDPQWTRVDTEPDYLDGLKNLPDIILSDFSMPQFSGIRAAEILRHGDLNIPFILVSGTVGEDVAVEAMRRGATDYLIKDRIARLGAAVEHALEQKALREESRRAARRLRESEERFRQLAENIQEVFWVSDPVTLRLLYLSPAAEKIWGADCSALFASAEAITAAIHPEDREHILKAGRLGLADGTFDEEFRIVRPDGAVCWIRARAFPVAGAAGGVARVVGLARDITERKEAIEALRLFRTLVDQSSDTFEVVDPQNGRYIDVNANGPAERGYTREEYLSMTVFDLDRNIQPAAWLQSVRERSTRGSARGEGRHWRKDGTSFPIEYRAKLVRLERDYIVATIRDITERKETEEALRESERRFREQAAMLDHAHEAIIVHDIHDEQITFWSRGAQRLYGWSAAEAQGRGIGALIFDDPSAPGGVSAELLKSGEWHGEQRHLTKEGGELIVSSHATLVRDPQGAPKSALVINIDVTNQKKLEEQFLRAQRMESIGTLASGVAHDLNNILTPILMAAPALRYDMPGETRESIISTIEKSAERGVDIVKQVLTFARGVKTDRLLVNPTHLVNEIAKIARQTFPKSITVTARYPDSVWTVEGDPTQLHQVLLNLCVNARDAMPNGGELIVAAANFTVDEQYAGMMPDSRIGPYVRFSVSDTGSGIPPEVIEKIFDPFFTTKEVGKGTGLGLSTVIGIVKNHGGFLTVESEAGRGAVFKFFIPATCGDVTAAPVEAPATAGDGNGELILVVDDEENLLNVTKTILERRGYRVITALDGAEALSLFAQKMREIRAIVADVMMPHMDGASLARVIRRMSPATPIIACSGQWDEAREAKLKELGVKVFLRKPYNTEKLLIALGNVLEAAASEPSG